MSLPLRTNFSIHVIWNQQKGRADEHGVWHTDCIWNQREGLQFLLLQSHLLSRSSKASNEALVTFNRLTKKPPGTPSLGCPVQCPLALIPITCPSQRATADTYRVLVHVIYILSRRSRWVSLGATFSLRSRMGGPCTSDPEQGAPMGNRSTNWLLVLPCSSGPTSSLYVRNAPRAPRKPSCRKNMACISPLDLAGTTGRGGATGEEMAIKGPEESTTVEEAQPSAICTLNSGKVIA
jgi:hypothetical protein